MNRALAGQSVLVLGASGYLGQHICTAFAAAGTRVIRVGRGTRDDGANRAGGESQADPGDVTTGIMHLDLTAADCAALARLCAGSGAQVVVNAVGAVWKGTEDQMTELNARLVGRLTDAIATLPRTR